MIAAIVFAQLCGAATPDGVVVTEGRGGYGAVIAMREGAVVVGWQETGPRSSTGDQGPAQLATDEGVRARARPGDAGAVYTAPTDEAVEG